MKGQQQQQVISANTLVHLRYRDRVDIISDVLLKLVEYGELNQTALMSFRGLNLTKHRSIIEELEAHRLIQRQVETISRAKTISLFKLSPGLAFLREILEPYEKMFPRRR